MEQIGLFDAIYTQRAIRNLKSDPIPEEVLYKVLEAATKAPSGSNRQPWAFIVIRDRDLKRRIGEHYRKVAAKLYADRPAPEQLPSGDARPWSDHPEDIPVLIMVCYLSSVGDPPAPPGVLPRTPASRYASVYPAVQNLLLAARGLGLGAVLTTMQRRDEVPIKELLGIPEDVETCCLIPLGYPVEGSRYGPTKRQPVSEIVHNDYWGRMNNPDP